MAYEAQVSILGGLLVDVEFTVAPAEPDVGIMSEYVDWYEIVGVNGKRKKNTDWIANKITPATDEYITDMCMIEYSGGCRFY